MWANYWVLLTIFSFHWSEQADLNPVEDQYGVRKPSLCEVCKLLAIEIMDRLAETSSHDVIEVGYDSNNKKRVNYNESETRWREVLDDPHICKRMHQYRLHKEHKNSHRFKKGTPQTFKTLNDLVKRGVQVKMDVPHELWDEPSVETAELYKQCVPIVGEYEEDLEKWFFSGQKEELQFYLCRDRVLKGKPHDCLFDEYKPNEGENNEQKKSTEETQESKNDEL